MKSAILRGRTATLAGAIAVTLCSGAVASASVAVKANLDVAAMLAAGVPMQTLVSGSVGSERVRYTVVLKDSPLALYRGERVSLHDVSKPYAVAPLTAKGRMDVHSAEAVSYISLLQQKQREFVSVVSAEISRPVQPLMQFQHAINAIVLELSETEAEALRQRDDVLLVDREHVETLLTDRGPTFIGADTIWNGTTTGGVQTQGEGMVIGMLDTGINWESPSFTATSPLDGYTHVNPLGSGNYLGLCKAGSGSPDATANHCNSKLIGMYNFTTEGSNTGDDTGGHGSHTASTVAGNHRNATYAGGTFVISGVAPHANIIAYKVCDASGCSSIATSAAVNQAVADGIVDAINYSISGGSSPWTDPTSMAFLGAHNAGIFVAAAAGNSGPGAATTDHLEPWVQTVAASRHDRIIGYPFNLTVPGPVPANAQNLPLRPGAAPLPTADIVNAPIIQSPGFANGNSDGCSAFAANTFKRGGTGAIAVLRLDQNNSGCGSGLRRTNALGAGAIGVIFVDPAFINLGASGTSWSMRLSDWNNVNAQIQTNPASAAASIPAVAAQFQGVGDVIANFSSRGPRDIAGGQMVIKPEIAAPGVDILAANQAGIPRVPGAVYLNNGTSMATPHVAGAAILLRALHPTWTPMQIKSALMMNAKTAGLVNESGADSGTWDLGAGRVDLAAAAKAGLILDETGSNFSAANPTAGGKLSSLNLPSLTEGKCVGVCSLTRTVRSARAGTVTWTLSVAGVPGANVSPSSFTVGSSGTRAFTVSVDGTMLPAGWTLGELTLTPSDPSVPVAHMPIAVRPGAPAINVSNTALSATLGASTTTKQNLTIRNVGNPSLNWSVFTPGQKKTVTVVDIPTSTSGYQVGYYTGLATPGYYTAENFDITEGTSIKTLRAKGFVLPGTTPLSPANTTEVSFYVYADADGKPAGAPNVAALPAAPLWNYSASIGAPGISIVGGNAINLDLTAAGVPALDLNPGRYWLVPFPKVLGNASQTAANPLWAWFYDSTLPAAGNRPVSIRSNGTTWATVPTAGVNHMAALVEGLVPCRLPSWAGYSLSSESLGLNGNSTMTVTFDSTGLAPGSYSGELCIASNDPAKPETIVGLSLSVPVPSSVPTVVTAVDSSSVNTGDTVLLTATVTPGANPASTGIQVRADLSSIGGSASQPLFDDGTNGDATAGDGVYSFAASIPGSVASGSKTLPVTVSDAQSRSASATITLDVGQRSGIAASTSAAPSTVAPGGTTHLAVTVAPGTNPPSSGITVKADLGSIGGSATQAFADEGNGVFGFDATLDTTTPSGARLIPVIVADAQGRTVSTAIALSVQAALPPGALSGSGLSAPGKALPGDGVLLIVTTRPGTNPDSTGVTVTVDLSAIGGSATQAFYDDGTHGDQAAGDGVYSFQATIDSGTALDQAVNLPVTISDAQGRNAATTVPLMTGNDRIFRDTFEGP